MNRYTHLSALAATLFVLSSQAQSISNGSFETPNIPDSTIQHSPPGADWVFNSLAGIADITPDSGTGSAPFEPPIGIFAGSQLAFLQLTTSPTDVTGTGEFSQSIVFSSAGVFALSYQVAGRGDSSALVDGFLDYGVFLDSVQIGSGSTLSLMGWQQQFVEFAADTGAHTLTFRALGSITAPSGVGEHTALFDQVDLVPVPEPRAYMLGVTALIAGFLVRRRVQNSK